MIEIFTHKINPLNPRLQLPAQECLIHQPGITSARLKHFPYFFARVKKYSSLLDRLANVTTTFSPRSQNNSISSSPGARQSNLIHQLTNRLLICPQLYRHSQPSRSIQPFTGRTGYVGRAIPRRKPHPSSRHRCQFISNLFRRFRTYTDHPIPEHIQNIIAMPLDYLHNTRCRVSVAHKQRGSVFINLPKRRIARRPVQSLQLQLQRRLGGAWVTLYGLNSKFGVKPNLLYLIPQRQRRSYTSAGSRMSRAKACRAYQPQPKSQPLCVGLRAQGACSAWPARIPSARLLAWPCPAASFVFCGLLRRRGGAADTVPVLFSLLLFLHQRHGVKEQTRKPMRLYQLLKLI